ncbi:MAG: PocR ligand-binding domain-containing protein [Caldilineaceae bacterium]|nr:PocR ligand-binding domain-containing protein [Caldilineaceae bacterium]
MSDFFTTRQLQNLLQVDRTTIYRMADSGRVPAVKVGNQWRFPRYEVEAWLKTRPRATNGSAPRTEPSKAVENLRKLLPLECVQLIQDTFADLLGVMVLITDLEGALVTRPSNPCGLFTAAETSPQAQQRCMQLWADLAREPGMHPRFTQSHLGLMCARGLIRVGSELQAMVVVGGIAPENWPPSAEELGRIAADLELPEALLRRHQDEVFHVKGDEQQRLLTFVQRIADIVSHIIQERNQFYTTLHSIAELTRI